MGIRRRDQAQGLWLPEGSLFGVSSLSLSLSLFSGGGGGGKGPVGDVLLRTVAPLCLGQCLALWTGFWEMRALSPEA